MEISILQCLQVGSYHKAQNNVALFPIPYMAGIGCYLRFVGQSVDIFLNEIIKIIKFLFFFLKFDTKLNGKPVKSRLPVFCLHVVYLPDLAQEKIFLIF